MSARSPNRTLLLFIVVGPFAVLAIGIAIMRGTGGPPAPPQPVAAGALARANLLLVTISALRPDHLGVYGSSGSLTPAIDEFAKEGLRFERTYAHVPSTVPSHRTLMTAAYPNRGEPAATLAERLKAGGYRTGAFVGSPALGAESRLARGFDRYDDRIPNGSSRDATQVFGAAYEWIATRGWGLE
ncbi:MAG: sulfatase-like hydrolase/transferase, partial [Acidobacteria bacterium]|nr:sulfatase-like hydrolase/transferase [Acidobacteriota bacterium]